MDTDTVGAPEPLAETALSSPAPVNPITVIAEPKECCNVAVTAHEVTALVAVAVHASASPGRPLARPSSDHVSEHPATEEMVWLELDDGPSVEIEANNFVPAAAEIAGDTIVVPAVARSVEPKTVSATPLVPSLDDA
jgi:hypothetical protein